MQWSAIEVHILEVGGSNPPPARDTCCIPPRGVSWIKLNATKLRRQSSPKTAGVIWLVGTFPVLSEIKNLQLRELGLGLKSNSR